MLRRPATISLSMVNERRNTAPSIAELPFICCRVSEISSSSRITPPWARRTDLAISFTSSSRVVRTVRRSLLSAMLSICRMRSRVTLKCFPIFSSVCFWLPCSAKRLRITIDSLSVKTRKRFPNTLWRSSERLEAVAAGESAIKAGREEHTSLYQNVDRHKSSGMHPSRRIKRSIVPLSFR